MPVASNAKRADAGWRTSPGAPKGNKNVLKHDRYAAEAMATRRKIAKLLRDGKALAKQVT